MIETNTHFFNQEEPHKYISLDGLDIDGNPATAKTAIEAEQAEQSAGLGKLVEFPGTYKGPEADDDGSQDTPEEMFARMIVETKEASRGLLDRLNTPAKVAAVAAAGVFAVGAMGIALTSSGETTLGPAVKDRVAQIVSYIK